MNTPENWETALQLWWQSLSFEDVKAFLYSFLDLIGTDRNLANGLYLLIAILGMRTQQLVVNRKGFRGLAVEGVGTRQTEPSLKMLRIAGQRVLVNPDGVLIIAGLDKLLGLLPA